MPLPVQVFLYATTLCMVLGVGTLIIIVLKD